MVVHPRDRKWDIRLAKRRLTSTYTTYNEGYKLLSKWDEPPSRDVMECLNDRYSGLI